jgi:tRNA (guanine37-N1)-methyltransferase
MKYIVLTIFPEMFKSFWEHGIIRRAIENKKIFAETSNIRDFAEGRHQVTDDTPYGGGSGMVMKPEPLVGAIRAARKKAPEAATILLTPQGRGLNQDLARKLADFKALIFVCGRYEGIDERICDDFVDFEVSIGDYVLTGGELPAMVTIEAVTRMIPGTLGGEDAAEKDSFADDLLEHAHYTKPRMFEGEGVPDVLLSGNHKAIDAWRRESSLIRTLLKRKDLLRDRTLSREEIKILKTWCLDIEKIIHAQSFRGTDALSGGQQGR